MAEALIEGDHHNLFSECDKENCNVDILLIMDTGLSGIDKLKCDTADHGHRPQCNCQVEMWYC